MMGRVTNSKQYNLDGSDRPIHFLRACGKSGQNRPDLHVNNPTSEKKKKKNTIGSNFVTIWFCGWLSCLPIESFWLLQNKSFPHLRAKANHQIY